MVDLELRRLYCYGLFFSFFILINCSHRDEARFGLQTDNLAYIPARIAVLPCQSWPQLASYPGMPLTNIKNETLAEICQKLDQFVLQGFSNQPYMRGLSPKVVLTLLERAKQTELLPELNQAWRRLPDSCTDCTSAITYYKQSLGERKGWRLWLSEFSRSVYNSDAVLIPFLTYAHEGRTDDRGLMVAYRKIGVFLFLIDTNTAQLIWAGGREAEARKQTPRAKAVSGEPAFPQWEEVLDRLLINEIWEEFPGRQNY